MIRFDHGDNSQLASQTHQSREMQEAENLKSNSAKPFINISAYKFVQLDDLSKRREELLKICLDLGLKGTVLLSQEGINVFVAGLRPEIDQLVSYFESKPEYRGLPVKESESDEQPFTRTLVRIKKEIIAFGVEGIEPATKTSPKLKPVELKKWLDEGRPVTLFDVRNDYEVELGTFDNAKPVGIDHFRNFPEAVNRLPEAMKKETVVMFCTGGIRCEKAGPLMEREGFENIYQLDGGILKYFEDCGGEHYDGECFVFDKRVAVDSELNETETTQCYACQHPLTTKDQQSESYIAGEQCPYCFQTAAESMQNRIERRMEKFRELCRDLPGSVPYDNHRPLNVPLRFANQTVEEFLTGYHPHVDVEYWNNEVESGRILYKDQPVSRETQVWAGQRLVHLLAGTVEPDVNSNLELIYEDDDLIAINKPAPIAMHPCGRFNRNTVSYLLNSIYVGEKIRMTHRLDANTTGVVVFARKRLIAQQIQAQFESGQVRKTYLARVRGLPDQDQFSCDVRISREPGTKGLRQVDCDGHDSLTQFEVLEKFKDGTSLIKCLPQTGRTNQIRIHLWHLGLPIVNDPSYLINGQLGINQTLELGEPAMCLHAWKLSFEHPVSHSSIELEAQLPDWCQ